MLYLTMNLLISLSMRYNHAYLCKSIIFDSGYYICPFFLFLGGRGRGADAPLSIILFSVPPLGTIAYAPSYFIDSTYLIVDAWLGNMSDARSISSRIKVCLSESEDSWSGNC